MKKGVLLGVLVSLAVVGTAFLLVRQRVLPLITRQTAARAKQSAPLSGIPDADWRDRNKWRSTPEYKTVMDELFGIAQAADARGGPTADETEVLINYMYSPHYDARVTAAIVAGSARFDPARSVLIPHVLGLLSDPVSEVRLWAASSLGSMGDKSMIPFLNPLLNDPSPPVVHVTQRAISRLQSQKENVPGK